MFFELMSERDGAGIILHLVVVVVVVVVVSD